MNIAVIVATPFEAQGLRDLGPRVFVSGVGAVNAALAAHEALSREPFDLVVSAGIGGAYPNSGLGIGEVAVSSEMIYAGLGAVGSEPGDGEPGEAPHVSGRPCPDAYLPDASFLDLEDLGLPLLPGVFNRLPAWDGARAWAARLGAACGPILTLETVTGSDARAHVLEARYPGALAEGMEGAGVAHAALRLGVPAVEVRGISNFVGPRDRAGWRVADGARAYQAALTALSGFAG